LSTGLCGLLPFFSLSLSFPYRVRQAGAAGPQHRIKAHQEIISKLPESLKEAELEQLTVSPGNLLPLGKSSPLLLISDCPPSNVAHHHLEWRSKESRPLNITTPPVDLGLCGVTHLLWTNHTLTQHAPTWRSQIPGPHL
ncbi:hypothetical protein CRENBAI_025769, partial [Crenichthys baileyi]